MSKERARAREAREAERAVEREKTAKARGRQELLAALTPSVPQLPRRRRRYGAMPVRRRLALGAGFLAVQWVFWQLTGDSRSRFGLALVSLLALPLAAVLIPKRGPR
ncbi:MAG: hypothetical protein LC789_14090 [Actinobacteria bacterium]|nr:hypothetical protein [Actinomycetota bacterium]MCA1720744.1 hypothetical protein [Actinomycetota bacterium]